MRKLGLITVGQTPRTDVLVDLIPIFGDSVELHQAGALDGLTAEDIAAFDRIEGEALLISKLKDGSSVFFPRRCILPRLQSCIDRLEAAGVEMILFLCTEDFPSFRCRVPIYFPNDILNGTAPALAPRSKVAVIIPKEEQIEQTRYKWREQIEHLVILIASPYGDPAELERAAENAAAMDVDLVVMDCIGYTEKMKQQVAAISGKPVMLSRTIAARVIAEQLL